MGAGGAEDHGGEGGVEFGGDEGEAGGEDGAGDADYDNGGEDGEEEGFFPPGGEVLRLIMLLCGRRGYERVVGTIAWLGDQDDAIFAVFERRYVDLMFCGKDIFQPCCARHIRQMFILKNSQSHRER